LEGSLARVLAFSRLSCQPPTVGSAEEVLQDLLRRDDRRIGIQEILRETCKYFGVTEDGVRGPRRTSEVTRPRQVCMYLTRNLTRHSLGEIGSHFSHRDHTTVMHAIEKISTLMESDPTIRAAVTVIRERLNLPT